MAVFQFRRNKKCLENKSFLFIATSESEQNISRVKSWSHFSSQLLASYQNTFSLFQNKTVLSISLLF